MNITDDLSPEENAALADAFDSGLIAETFDRERYRHPVRCVCGSIYDLANVEVTARYADCSMWKAPCCKRQADDRQPPWGIKHYTDLTKERSGISRDGAIYYW